MVHLLPVAVSLLAALIASLTAYRAGARGEAKPMRLAWSQLCGLAALTCSFVLWPSAQLDWVVEAMFVVVMMVVIALPALMYAEGRQSARRRAEANRSS